MSYLSHVVHRTALFAPIYSYESTLMPKMSHKIYKTRQKHCSNNEQKAEKGKQK